MNKLIISTWLGLISASVWADAGPSGAKNYVMKPGYPMQEEEKHIKPRVDIRIPAEHRHHDNTTIITTVPGGGMIYYGTRVAPIVVERTYIQPARPDLSYSQQQVNLRFINDVISAQPTSIVDAGFGYFVPGPGGVLYYHSKSGNMAPMTIDEFLRSDEYYYLTGDRK